MTTDYIITLINYVIIGLGFGPDVPIYRYFYDVIYYRSTDIGMKLTFSSPNVV